MILYYIILYYDLNNLIYFLTDDIMTYLCALIIYCLFLSFGLYYFIALTHSSLRYLLVGEDSLCVWKRPLPSIIYLEINKIF